MLSEQVEWRLYRFILNLQAGPGLGVVVLVFLHSPALIPEHVVYTTLENFGLSYCLFGILALLSAKQLKHHIPKQTP